MLKGSCFNGKMALGYRGGNQGLAYSYVSIREVDICINSIHTSGPERVNMGRHTQAYLLTYCGISAMGWSYALVSILASLVGNQKLEPPSEESSAIVGAVVVQACGAVIRGVTGEIPPFPVTSCISLNTT